MPPFLDSPRCLSPFPGNLFSLHCLDFQAEDRLNHGGTWDSPVGKPRGKALRERHRSLDPREGKRDTAATAREESARACPHSRRGLTPLGRLQKYPKIHVSTGEESSGSGLDSKRGLRPRHRLERNPERPLATRMETGLSIRERTRPRPRSPQQGPHDLTRHSLSHLFPRFFPSGPMGLPRPGAQVPLTGGA